MSINKKTITFTGCLLVKNDDKIDLDDLSKLFVSTEPMIVDTKFERFNVKRIEQYLTILLEDGNTLPRPETVTNIRTCEDEPNPRSEDQLETNKTLILIDGYTSYIWVSNTMKMSKIVNKIKLFYPKEKIYTKDIYDKDMFQKAIKSLDSIKFSLVPDMFNNACSISGALSEELLGYDATEAELHMKFDDKLVSKAMRFRLDELFECKDSFKRIMIQGRDENNLGLIFNKNSFSRKIDIETILFDNGTFNETNVFDALRSELNREKIKMGI